MSKPKLHKIFVYGTLRPKGEDATHRLDGYSMYDYGRFPYIMGDSRGAVVGNIIEVDDANLIYADQYEGVASGLYERHSVIVRKIGREATVTAFAYVAGPRLQPKKIASGDWNKR